MAHSRLDALNRPLLVTALLFVVAESFLGWWLWNDFSGSVSRSLERHQSELDTGFHSVVNSHRKLVRQSLHHLLSSPELLPLLAEAAANPGPDDLRRIRGRVYRALYPDYELLLEQDIRVLQFVLPDGRSLLRFNRPDLYDDVISEDRPLLAEVLSSGREGAAFENGRVYPGFRYAFPVGYGGKPVGVADFSLSYDGIRRTFEETGQTTGAVSQIVLRHDLLQAVTHPSAKSLFRQALIHPDFVVEDPESPLRDIFGLDPLPAWVDEIDHTLRGSPDALRRMAAGEPASQAVCTAQQGCYGVAMHPVPDSAGRAAAYVVAYTPMPEYGNLRNRILSALLAGTLLIFGTAALLNRWFASRDRLRTISEHMGEGMYVVDREGRIIYVNPAASQILGYTDGELSGASAHALFHTDSHGAETDNDHCPIRLEPLGGAVYSSDGETFRRKNGDVLPVAVTSSPLRENGVVNGAVVLFRDISREHEDRKRLRQADTALQQLAEGVLVADVDSRIVAVNEAFTKITGYSDADALGRTPAILRSGYHDDQFYAAMWQDLLQNDYWEGEVWNRRKTGEIYPEWLKITTMKNDTGRATGFVAVFSDITEKQRNEERLQDLAYRDQLTGLHNRTSFLQVTRYVLMRAKRNGKRAALLFLDLDRFKRINDTLGHVAGDHLLKQVAERLRTSLREHDVIARLGGDEFTFLVDDVPDPETAARIARKLLDGLRAPFAFDNKRLNVTASIGVSMFPDDGTDCDTLLKNADAAMYLAKQSGRDQCRHFVTGMDHLSLQQFELEQALRHALEHDELTLFYQPKIALPSGEVIGMEALVRWQHPKRGLLTPFHFLDVAEEAGLMHQVTEQVLRMAAAQCAAWLAAGHENACIAVNLDAQFLRRSDAEQLLMTTIRQAGIRPEHLDLEIVETAIIQEEHYASLWKSLAERGFTISIDDFGTGESSLSRLKTIPVRVLKIDQSFVRDLELDEDDRAIVHTVIAMANTLGKDVIAEGVENLAQLRFLAEAGCRAIQGYYFSRPVCAKSAERFLTPGYFADKAGDAAPARNTM